MNIDNYIKHWAKQILKESGDSDKLLFQGKIENDVLTRYWGDTKEVIIPNHITEIGKRVFSEKHGLESVTIPNSVIKIGSSAFHGCTGLHELILPDSVIEIDDGAFSYSSLKTIKMSNNIKRIGDAAFYYCELLKEIVIPDSITHIGVNAFGNPKDFFSLYDDPRDKGVYRSTIYLNKIYVKGNIEKVKKVFQVNNEQLIPLLTPYNDN